MKTPQVLSFYDNETNAPKLFGAKDVRGFFKDGFHEFLVHGNKNAVNPAWTGTKVAGLFAFDLAASASAVVRVRLCRSAPNRAHCAYAAWLLCGCYVVGRLCRF